MPPNVLISVDFADKLAAISKQINRQVGVLINRQGIVEYTFVGDAQRIYLPDIGRARAGRGRLRALRHIHTVLHDIDLQSEDLADLSKLNLDCVCSLTVLQNGTAGALRYAYLLPSNAANRSHRSEKVRQPQLLQLDFAALMEALEAEQASLQGKRIHTLLAAKECAVIVGVYPNRHTSVWRLQELSELAQTAGVMIADSMVQISPKIDGQALIGKGKLEEAVLRCLEVDASLLIVDHNLSPAQARSMASRTQLRIIDRTQLILDIFAQHATSRDGKLQVELAQLKYNLPRLTDLDAGLSRLSGGIGGRGPGETKLEINRRRARDRINRLEKEIAQLSHQRGLMRKNREGNALPVLSIVGYTNAGKSTLLNKLTGSDALVANKLFATLDPKSRRLFLAPHKHVIVTDTVGFIHELPEDLMHAFRATLEELERADLLLHVVDISDAMCEFKIQAVQDILQSLNLGTIPRLLVLNKADLRKPYAARALADKLGGMAVSAESGDGLQEMLHEIDVALFTV